MGCIRLERIEPETNKRRCYLVTWARTLWKTWAVWREWGSIGEDVRGTRISEFAIEDEALHLTSAIVELRLKHGHQVKSVSRELSRSNVLL